MELLSILKKDHKVTKPLLYEQGKNWEDEGNKKIDKMMEFKDNLNICINSLSSIPLLFSDNINLKKKENIIMHGKAQFIFETCIFDFNMEKV